VRSRKEKDTIGNTTATGRESRVISNGKKSFLVKSKPGGKGGGEIGDRKVNKAEGEQEVEKKVRTCDRDTKGTRNQKLKKKKKRREENMALIGRS